MKHLLALSLFIACSATLVFGQSKELTAVKARTSLTGLVDGNLALIVWPPDHAQDTLIYVMPRIVPGTYSISNFGNMLSDVKAYTIAGDTLPIEQMDENRWAIANARNLNRLEYLVAPTFTDPRGKHIFEPAGTRFEKDRTFILNSFGIVGFFEGWGDAGYTFEVRRPADFYGATALQQFQLNDTTDIFSASDYFSFHDSPIMYARPDTSSFYVGNTEIQIALYSPAGSLSAQFVQEQLEDIMRGAQSYLGDTLPVSKYVVLISLMQGMGNSGGYGALEHFYSTVFVMPEMGADFLARNIRDVVAHEFFHIVTPLNIHSEHIHDYDFIDPGMSKHLWLYEGVTEYSAHHMQVREGLIDKDEFLSIVRQKIVQSGAFKDTLPFTELSYGALDEQKGQYMNVYMKGALIGMCLDLLLCDLSGGTYNLPMLMADLSDRFGAERHFKDDELFDLITSMTYPQVRTFFARYVEGTETLPMEEYLSKAGVFLQRNATITELTFGGFLPGHNKEKDRMEVITTIGMNSFGRELGLEKGDLLINVNGIELKPETFSENINSFKNNYTDGDKVTLVVERQNEKGQWNTVKLKARAKAVEREVKLRMSYQTDLTEEQSRVRKAWINQ